MQHSHVNGAESQVIAALEGPPRNADQYSILNSTPYVRGAARNAQ